MPDIWDSLHKAANDVLNTAEEIANDLGEEAKISSLVSKKNQYLRQIGEFVYNNSSIDSFSLEDPTIKDLFLKIKELDYKIDEIKNKKMNNCNSKDNQQEEREENKNAENT